MERATRLNIQTPHRKEPGTFLLWVSSANHHIIPPCCPVWFVWFVCLYVIKYCLNEELPWRVWSSNNQRVGGSIPTHRSKKDWQLEGWQFTSLSRLRCPWARHLTPMLPGRCNWLPTAPVYECVTLCMCICVCSTRCRPGWVKCGGQITCMVSCMTNKT